MGTMGLSPASGGSLRTGPSWLCLCPAFSLVPLPLVAAALRARDAPLAWPASLACSLRAGKPTAHGWWSPQSCITQQSPSLSSQRVLVRLSTMSSGLPCQSQAMAMSVASQPVSLPSILDSDAASQSHRRYLAAPSPTRRSRRWNLGLLRSDRWTRMSLTGMDRSMHCGDHDHTPSYFVIVEQRGRPTRILATMHASQ